jgi:hypothetical protein
MKKYVNGILMDMSAEDIAQYNEDQKTFPTEFDVSIEHLREIRNSLLAKTDWTASSDLTMSGAMKTYRQQLRDAPSGLDTVEKVEAYEFPTEVLK